MKLLLLFSFPFLSVSNCATMAVYDLVYPNTWKMSTDRSDLKDVKLVDEKKIQFILKSWTGEKRKCAVPYEGTYAFELYAYSVSDCSKEKPIEDSLAIDSAFKSNHLPVLNEENTVLDLSKIDTSSEYFYSDKLGRLLYIELKEVFYDKKKNKIYLISKSNHCTILGRTLNEKKISQYGIETDWAVDKSNCINEKNRNDLESISFYKNDKYTIYLNFRDSGYLVYSSKKLTNPREAKSFLFLIRSLEEKNNYAYTVLFPPAIIFDVVTFPFQIIYFFIVGSAIPVR